MIAVIKARGGTLQRLDGRRQAALELVVVVGIENVVLAVVLIVEDGIDRREA